MNARRILTSALFVLLCCADVVPTGIAVQDGNLDEINPETGKRVAAAGPLEFATEYLKVNYVFRGTQGPYFSREATPLLTRQKP